MIIYIFIGQTQLISFQFAAEGVCVPWVEFVDYCRSSASASCAFFFFGTGNVHLDSVSITIFWSILFVRLSECKMVPS